MSLCDVATIARQEPAEQAEPAARVTPAAPAGGEAADARQGGGTVLAVDDEEIVRYLMESILREFGFEVLTAVDGLDAIEVYRRHQTEIVAVLLDLTMPKLDGTATFRELRRIRPDLPVVLSSGHTAQVALRGLIDQGIAGFIQKPYRPEELIRTLRAAIAG